MSYEGDSTESTQSTDNNSVLVTVPISGKHGRVPYDSLIVKVINRQGTSLDDIDNNIDVVSEYLAKLIDIGINPHTVEIPIGDESILIGIIE